MGEEVLCTQIDREVVQGRETTRSARALAMGVFILVLATYSKVIGLPADTLQVFGWMWLGVTAWNIQAPPRAHLAFLADWWPALAVIEVYVYSRGVTAHLGLPVHFTEPIRFDSWLGSGQLPTQHLQKALCGDPCTSELPSRWYDGVLTCVYYTHFIAGPLVALVLWLHDRSAWLAFMRRYVTLFIGGLYIYIVYPMAPPWMASRDGYIAGNGVPRITGRGWEEIGLQHFQQTLSRLGNQVAAMPSLHAGVSALISFYGIARLRSRWRVLLLLYPATMAVMLVYYGEHYVIDVIAGWALAGGVMAVCANWERGGRLKRAAQVAETAILRGQQHGTADARKPSALAPLRRLPALWVPCVLLALTVVSLRASPHAAIPALLVMGGFLSWLTRLLRAEGDPHPLWVRVGAFGALAAVLALQLGQLTW